MNVYSIDVIHHAPKGSHQSIQGYVLAENDEQVYDYIKSEPKIDDIKLYNSWEVYENVESNEYREDFKKEMLEVGGELYTDYDVTDAYYGREFYGWTLLQENVNINLLEYAIKIGLIIFICQQK